MYSNYFSVFLKKQIEQVEEIPARLIVLLVNFLEQNIGKLFIRAKEKDFKAFTEKEIG